MIQARLGGARRCAALWAAAWLAAPLAVRGADLAEVAARGILRVVVAADEAPETFSFRPGGLPGFERELIEAFARLRGLKVHAVAARGYADRIPMLVRGEGDVILAIFDTEDRRRLVDFTAEVMPTHNVAVTLASRPPVEDLGELRAARVGVIRGAKPAEEAVQAGLPAAALLAFDRRDQLLEALQNGTVAAAILPVSELAVASKRFAGLRAGMVVGTPGKVAWAVRKTDDALEAALNEYIGNVRRGPTWSRLIVKYFGDQALAVLGRGQK